MAFLAGIEASHGCCHLKIERYDHLGLHFFINNGENIHTFKLLILNVLVLKLILHGVIFLNLFLGTSSEFLP